MNCWLVLALHACMHEACQSGNAQTTVCCPRKNVCFRRPLTDRAHTESLWWLMHGIDVCRAECNSCGRTSVQCGGQHAARALKLRHLPGSRSAPRPSYYNTIGCRVPVILYIRVEGPLQLKSCLHHTAVDSGFCTKKVPGGGN